MRRCPAGLVGPLRGNHVIGAYVCGRDGGVVWSGYFARRGCEGGLEEGGVEGSKVAAAIGGGLVAVGGLRLSLVFGKG